MQIEIAGHAGACYGVNRALSIALKAAAEGSVANTLGPLIHNPTVVDGLKMQGVGVIDTLDDAPEGSTVIIRSHGVTPDVIEDAKRRGLSVVDATCPHVSKAQLAAHDLSEKGYKVVVVGEAGHPEVEGILAWAGNDAIAASSPSDLPEDLGGPIGVVVQTTQSTDVLDAVVGELEKRTKDLIVRNTVCFATKQRQESARELAARVDAMIVIGGRNSGNTRRLYEICKARCANSHHIESSDEIDPSWFAGCSMVGVTAGASTPKGQIDAVMHALRMLP